MSITQIDIHILNNDRKGFRHLKTVHPGQLVNTDALLKRLAHTEAAQELNRRFPLQWCYRYGKLVDGVTLETPGVITNYRWRDGTGIDGVTDMNLIADDGFTGQFQWKTGHLGELVPAYVTTTDPEKQAEYERREKERRAEEARKSAEVDAKLATLPRMIFSDDGQAKWQEYVAANSDDYGGACVRYAERWARLMQAENRHPLSGDDAPLNASALFADIAERTSHEADAGIGITGFMYGAAVNMLAQCWAWGEELRVWHNQKYGHNGDGVVNPAVLIIGGNDDDSDSSEDETPPTNPPVSEIEAFFEDDTRDADLEMRRGG